MSANPKHIFLSNLARIGRAYDVRGALRLVRVLYPPEKAVADPIRTIIDYDDRVRMHIDTGSFIEWVIFFKGYYNLGLTKLLRAFLRPGQVIFDVGANIGQHSLIMCHLVGPEGKVYMFEPQPEVRSRLEMNIKLNGFQNGTVIATALSDRVGTAELHSFAPGTANQGNATLAATDHPDLSHAISVEVETLDSAARRLSPSRVDFIKIDTQGNDVAVLRGATETITKFRPRITVRYDAGLYSKAGASYADLKKIFDSYRYRHYILRKTGLSPVEAEAGIPSEVIYAVPEESVIKEHPQGFGI